MTVDTQPIDVVVTSAYNSARRAEYARQTRGAILGAARELFRERGYGAARVDDIAERARVAPATVYAVGGGKAALLAFWTNAWSADPMLEPLYEKFGQLVEPHEVLRLAVRGVSENQAKWSDVIRVVRDTAPDDIAIRHLLDVATERYRAAVRLVIDRLHELSALAPHLEGDLPRATDILWFYLGNAAPAVLLRENGWSQLETEKWLASQAALALGVSPAD